MSASQILNTSGRLIQDVLPVSQLPALASPVISQIGGAVAAPLTGTFNCPETGNYIIQLYVVCSGSGASVGTGSFGFTYDYTVGGGDGGWGTGFYSATTLSVGAAYTQTFIGSVAAGSRTFQFSPSSGMNLGASGFVAVRVLKALV